MRVPRFGVWEYKAGLNFSRVFSRARAYKRNQNHFIITDFTNFDLVNDHHKSLDLERERQFICDYIPTHNQNQNQLQLQRPPSLLVTPLYILSISIFLIFLYLIPISLAISILARTSSTFCFSHQIKLHYSLPLCYHMLRIMKLRIHITPHEKITLDI